MNQPLTVLIVEDEGLIAANLEMILEDAGWCVVGWATDAAEAFSIARSNPPRVAVVDVQLRNGDDGIALAAEMQERFGTEIIFVTAQTDPRTVSRARSIKHRAFVGKPYTRSAIIAALSQL